MSNEMSDYQEQQFFENEVRRIARSLWPSAQYNGAEMVDGKERDGIFKTEDIIHLVECTVSRSKQKAIDDSSKLVKLWKRKRTDFPGTALKCWFITRDEPTAEQRGVIEESRKKNNGLTIEAISMEQFRNKLIDVSTYLDCRENFNFGSMQEQSKSDKRNFKYVPFDILSDSSQAYSIQEICQAVAEDKQRFILLGDYGAGKSTTMREIFFNIRDAFRRNEKFQFPVLLNLRDHFGQRDAAEALERHAKLIGFEPYNQLIRAWRAGYIIILLDGFDEIATPGWQGQPAKLKKLRWDSMQLIRNFLKETPNDRGIIISGRQNYFDSRVEMKDAFALGDNAAIYLNLNDFNEAQVQKYLERRGWNGKVPLWLPTRPLLLAYLATGEFLPSIIETDKTQEPASGWDLLLTSICEREAEVDVGISGSIIRQLIERLASKARNSNIGLGPLSVDEIIKTFQEVCNFAPDDRSMILIQRLPGLGEPNANDGARSFIDQSLVDAARAGDVVRFIEDPHTFAFQNFENWQIGLSTLGIQVASHILSSRKQSDTKLSTALPLAARKNENYVLATDLLHLMQERGIAYQGGDYVYIKGVWVENLEFDEMSPDFSRVEFQDCGIKHLELSLDVPEKNLPKFSRCMFGTVEGRVSETEMTNSIFQECAFDDFINAGETNTAVLSLNMPLACRVLLVILRKLYLQSGAGRRESALMRGLDHKGKILVPEILSMLSREGLAIEYKAKQSIVWLPVRSEMARVQQLIAEPTVSTDTLMRHARLIQKT